MGFLSSAIGALAAPVVGGLFGQKGQERTNQANTANAKAQMSFQEQENIKNRRFQEASANTAMDFSAGETALNRKFQESMSNTAVTRRMQDMKNAGINPILAAKYDASSPAGNVASGIAQSGNTAAGAMAVHQNPATSAISAANAVTDITKKTAETDKIEQEIDVLAAKEQLTSQQTETLKEQTKKIINEAKKVMVETFGIEYENISKEQKAQFLKENPHLSKIQTISETYGIKAADFLRVFEIGLIGKAATKIFKNGDNLKKKIPGKIMPDMKKWLNQ